MSIDEELRIDYGDTLKSVGSDGNCEHYILLEDKSKYTIIKYGFGYFPKIYCTSSTLIIKMIKTDTTRRISMVLTEKFYEGLTKRVNEGENDDE